jgi:DNA-binding transcriptional LysR family regulator
MRLTQLRQTDLNLLVVFAVFAEERNVSRAAKRLGLSQPAVSRALHRLRDTFQDDLFVRTSVGYELTPRSQRLLQELEVMLPKLDRLLSSPAFDPSLEEATFRIGTTDGAGSTLAPIICREIVPVATRVRFEFCQWHTGMLDELAHGSVDLVFLASVVEVPSSLNSQLVYDEEFVCAVDAQSPFKKRMTFEQYMAAQHVAVTIQRGIQVAPDKHLAAQGYRRQVAIQVPFHETAIRCVAGTKFVATVPRKFVEGMAQSPGIRIVKAPVEVGGFRCVMIWHPRLNMDSAHAWLRSTMLDIGKALAADGSEGGNHKTR